VAIVESQSGESEQKQQQQQQQPGGPLSRNKIVQRLLAAGSNLPAFIQELLTAQAVTVVGTEAAGFLIEADREKGGAHLKLIAHIRPDDSTPEIRQAAVNAFAELIRPCVQQGRDGAIEIESPGENVEPQYCLVTLLRSEGNVVAVSAVVTRCRDAERAQQRLMSMEMVAGYFEVYSLRRKSEQTGAIAQSHQHVLQLATAVATADGFESAAMNLCNELAARTGATRVSIGWLKGRGIKLKAMSHTEQFDRKQELSVAIEKAMEECLDQEEIVQYEADGTGSENVSRAAQLLSKMQGGTGIISLPLRRKDEIHGVVTLEFPPNYKLAPQAATGLAVAAELLAPQLYDRYENDRYLITKMAISTREATKLAIGPKHWVAKLIIAAVIALIVAVCVVKVTYHVTAPFAFAATDPRKVGAPFEGIIEKVYKDVNSSPKDRIVKKGEPLLELQTYQYKLELIKAKTTAEQARTKAHQLLYVEQKSAEGKQAMKEAEAADADAALAQWKIDNATVRAPIDGEILAGDQKENLQAPVKEGQELYTIADRSHLRAELSVPEREVQELREGQKGKLTSNSDPGREFDFTVDTIFPEGEAKEGGNFFKVYGNFDTPLSPEWRPGLQGEANVNIDKRRIVWIWTHKFTEWVELEMWKMF
jgi:RND family efflux transporter MFP subunit